MSPAAPILLFDSGVGGLTVLAELRRLLPEAPVIYFADTDAIVNSFRAKFILVVGAAVIWPNWTRLSRKPS